MNEIPVLATPFFTETVTLTGTDYDLAFQYCQREDRWYLSVYTTEGDPIYVGQKIVPSIPLFRKCADGRKPLGTIVAQTLTLDDTPPRLLELGDRIKLYYYEPGEL